MIKKRGRIIMSDKCLAGASSTDDYTRGDTATCMTDTPSDASDTRSQGRADWMNDI